MIQSSLRMLIVSLSIYLKSVLRCKFITLDTYHSDILYLCEQGCEDPWLFFEDKGVPRGKMFGKHWCTICYQGETILGPSALGDEVFMFLRNAGKTHPSDTASHSRRPKTFEPISGF